MLMINQIIKFLFQLLSLKFHNIIISRMLVFRMGQIEKGVAQLLSKNQRALVLLTSDKNQKGVYWCKDCEIAAPHYEQFQQEAKNHGIPFYIFMVDRPYWKDLKNYFRTSKQFHAKSVPTLGVWNGKKLTKKLVEGELLHKEHRGLIFQQMAKL